MTPFTFIFHGMESSGNFCASTRGKGWIKVIFFNHSAVILPAIFNPKKNKKIWVQNIQQGESVWPHELIQILGESIEAVPKKEYSEKFRKAETGNSEIIKRHPI
jgi:hypothetical protein